MVSLSILVWVFFLEGLDSNWLISVPGSCTLRGTWCMWGDQMAIGIYDRMQWCSVIRKLKLTPESASCKHYILSNQDYKFKCCCWTFGSFSLIDKTQESGWCCLHCVNLSLPSSPRIYLRTSFLFMIPLTTPNSSPYPGDPYFIISHLYPFPFGFRWAHLPSSSQPASQSMCTWVFHFLPDCGAQPLTSVF